MKRKKKHNISIFLILEIVTLFFLTGFYIFQANEVARFSYNIPQFEKQIAKLEADNQEMESKISAQYSDLNIDNLAVNMNFEKVQTIEYIEYKDNKVVKGE